MNYKNLLLHLLLCLQILTISLQASYPLKFVFLLPNILKKAVKTSVLWIPTFMGLSKMNEKIKEEALINEQIMLFMYPFDEKIKKEFVHFKNEIKDLALKSMPDDYNACKTPTALVEYVEDNKRKNFKKFVGKELDLAETSLQERLNKSKDAIKKLYNIDPDFQNHHDYANNNPEHLKTIVAMLKKAGYDTDSFSLSITNDYTAPASVEQLNNDVYYVDINTKYTQNSGLALSLLLHEIHHILSDDIYSDNELFKEAVLNKQKELELAIKEESSIIGKIIKGKKAMADISQTNKHHSNFAKSREYIADIKEIVTNAHLTKEDKIEILTQRAECIEDILTYKAVCQSMGQRFTDNIFNAILTQDNNAHIPEERTLPLYDLSLAEGFTHPSFLSRYQLIMRAKQLLKEEEEKKA